MANSLDLTTGVLRCDTAATVIATNSGEIKVQALEWVSDAAAAGGAMAAADKLIMTINGVTVEILCVIALSQTWVRQFTVPLPVQNLTVSTIDGGTLLVWLA